MILNVKNELMKKLEAIEETFEENILYMKKLLKLCDSDIFKYFLGVIKVADLKTKISQFLDTDSVDIILKVRQLKLDAEKLVIEYNIDVILLKIENDEGLTIDEKKALAVHFEKYN